VQRVSNLFEIVLTPPPKGSRQSAESIYAQLRAAILDGRLVAAAKLPVERQSALFFGVSRNTAARAYAKLALEGLVESRRGSGTYVLPKRKRPPRERAPSRRTPDPRLNPLWSRPELSRPELLRPLAARVGSGATSRGLGVFFRALVWHLVP